MTSLALRLLVAALVATTGAAPMQAAPLPVPKPDGASVAVVAPADVPAPMRFDDTTVAAVRSAVSSLDLNDLGGAVAAVKGRSQLEQDIVTWLAIRRQVSGLTPDAVTEFSTRNPHWPSTAIFRRRAEQALSRANLPAKAVVEAFASAAPISEEGTLALARALVADKRPKDAAKVLGPWWAKERLSPERDQQILREFGEILTRDDHKARFDTQMYADRVVQAEAMARLVGKEYVALAQARRAMLRRAADAAKRLDAVTGEARTDPLFAYTMAEFYRRADRNKEAAAALQAVPADTVLDHADAWWVERRIVSRGLLEAGDHQRAYELAADHRGGNPETVAEAHFHAGWYALQFLKNPAKARPHFQALQRSVSLPLSRSRAAYWLGRTEEAAGDIKAARSHYTVAASDEATFYGQLALVKLDRKSLDMPAEPEPTDDDRLAFAKNDLARAAVLLVKAGVPREAAPIVLELARQLPSGGQIAILADYLSRIGDHRSALQVGKTAADRNLGTERLAFPLDAIPESGRAQTAVEIALVYAIARQESAFDPAAVSHAGAMGLLQLLPGTAQATARALGMPFSTPRLTTDADYNATLGAAHLRELVDRFGGSYILTFAAYNAGPRKAQEWIQRFGDPRAPEVDPVDWIELIPYGETRSYVQRVMENLQVYRERLDGAPLQIAADLTRGAKGAEAVR